VEHTTRAIHPENRSALSQRHFHPIAARYQCHAERLFLLSKRIGISRDSATRNG
jgi:hypothetical protein